MGQKCPYNTSTKEKLTMVSIAKAGKTIHVFYENFEEMTGAFVGIGILHLHLEQKNSNCDRICYYLLDRAQMALSTEINQGNLSKQTKTHQTPIKDSAEKENNTFSVVKINGNTYVFADSPEFGRYLQRNWDDKIKQQIPRSRRSKMVRVYFGSECAYERVNLNTWRQVEVDAE
ncbi:hypothetical protein H6F67_05180 [Microcoleus sp. FACHB-1515]|uniref:hypothetical protein n=1 Tax=Cyanophyceae TaxID=3028117 RepID=UPI001688603F|nr:hypothetical protein [Microcoleus sp. FACHB-1515]MBD2089242.1 hypothetical protein [Microcoleus sp. FACHB-1515]